MTGARAPATPVSVIVPVFNRERHVAECIDSILATGYPNLEIVVVDDGSTDSTPAVLEEIRRREGEAVRVLHHDGGRNLGPWAPQSRDLPGTVALARRLLATDRSWLRDRGFVGTVGRVLLHRSAHLGSREAGA